jgi:hypothetical protein
MFVKIKLMGMEWVKFIPIMAKASGERIVAWDMQGARLKAKRKK